MHAIADGSSPGTWPCPVTAERAAGMTGARTAPSPCLRHRCAGGYGGPMRRDRIDALVAGAQGRPGVRLALVRPERHRPLGQSGDRQGRVHPRVGRHDASVHDVQSRLAEQTQVGINGPAVAAVADRGPADEVRRGPAVDDLEQQRALAAAHLLGQPPDELLDRRDMHRGCRPVPVAAPQPFLIPVQLDGGVGRLRAEHDDGPFGPAARIVEGKDAARMLNQVLDK